ncbi:hypothetical protein B7R21_15955 [Subtercola boreus]|uniref:Uncharacterized protein n=1 Tax=Subtercola boreus TaxID=120213 RepID=A0A3E0VDP2_9MICO|nr:hypothetical protein [Subtercola boreus]RFA07663.1 hypothetical protein B7R21_15955 [Subtercola boreus]
MTGQAMLFVVIGIAVLVTAVFRSRTDSFGRFTLILGDWVPAPLEVMAILTLSGLAVLVSGVSLGPGPTKRRRAVLRVGIELVLTLGLPAMFIAAVLCGNNYFQILPEASAGGCRIVIQHRFINGAVGIVQPDEVTVHWIGDWTADDFYDPFAYGTYSLVWRDRDGNLNVEGDGTDPASWTGPDSALHCHR